MGGIYGLVSNDLIGIPARLASMRQALTTGFEKTDEFWMDGAAGVGIGCLSLGVNDLGPQPVVDDAAGLVLFLDGILYATENLRVDLSARGYPAKEASQSSLVMYAYQVYGPAVVNHLQGIFLLVIWDKAQKKLFLANDRFGFRPLFYAKVGNHLAFASEVKALLHLGFVSRQVNDASVADLFAFGHLYGDRTLFRDIQILKPASIVTYQDGRMDEVKYWRVNQLKSDISRSEDDWVDEMVELLVRSVRRCADIWPDMGLSLSGGLDSRTLLAVATQSLNIRIPTYTYGLADSDDITRAREIASCANTPHFESIFKSDYLASNADQMIDRTEGLINILVSHGFNLLEMMPPREVLMLGAGAENLFLAARSYYKFSIVEGEDPVNTVFKVLNRYFLQDEWPALFTEQYFPAIDGSAIQSMRQIATDNQSSTPDELIHSVKWKATQRNTFHGIYMINHRLEYCMPYYDYDLVDFALTLPFELRWNRKLQKIAICRISPKLAILTSGGHLDVEKSSSGFWSRNIARGKRVLNRIISSRKKTQSKRKPSGTFTDLHELLRTSNRKWVESVLLDKRTSERGYFRPGYIRNLVEEHMNGTRNVGLQLGTLLTFELWQRRFVD